MTGRDVLTSAARYWKSSPHEAFHGTDCPMDKTIETLENRVEALEREVEQLKAAQSSPAPKANWIDDIYGIFADDPGFVEMVELGAQYRERDRAKARQTAKRKNRARPRLEPSVRTRA